MKVKKKIHAPIIGSIQNALDLGRRVSLRRHALKGYLFSAPSLLYPLFSIVF